MWNRSTVPPNPWAEPQHESLTGAWWLAEFLVPKLVYNPASGKRRLELGFGRRRRTPAGARYSRLSPTAIAWGTTTMTGNVDISARTSTTTHRSTDLPRNVMQHQKRMTATEIATLNACPRSIVILACVLSLQACVSTPATERSRPAIGTTRIALHGGLSAAQQGQVEQNCFEGMPEKLAEDLGPTEFVFRDGYVLEHSSLDKIPLWVCEGVANSQLGGGLARDDKFASDPDLKGSKAAPGDYLRSGYDRGHMAPAGNQTRSEELKRQTFYMSNMAPQLPTMNRGIWRILEERTRDMGRAVRARVRADRPRLLRPERGRSYDSGRAGRVRGHRR